MTRFVSYTTGRATGWGHLDGDTITDLTAHFSTLRAAIESGALTALAQTAGPKLALSDVTLTIPVTKTDSPARIRDYSGNANPAENAMVYIHDVTTDAGGHPVILYLTSRHHQPGPQGDPRTWNIARWTGSGWLFHPITTSTHNYDTGSIHIEDDGTWKVIGPTGTGPQKWGTGGEIELWISKNLGATWAKQRAVTADSPRNHSYARRPRNAHPDFHTYWADGDADRLSESHLYFSNQAGDKVWRLPYLMSGDFAAPVLVGP